MRFMIKRASDWRAQKTPTRRAYQVKERINGTSWAVDVFTLDELLSYGKFIIDPTEPHPTIIIYDAAVE